MRFYLTHVMTGHGNLGVYLERFKIKDYREVCETDTGPLSPASLLGIMMALSWYGKLPNRSCK